MKIKEGFKNIIAPIIVLVVIFIFLELIVRVFNISSQILPPPSMIIITLKNNLFGDLLPHLLITLEIMLISFLIGVPIGIVSAAIVSHFNILEKSLSPYVIMFVTTPFITLVPLFTMWLGFGIMTRIIIVILQTAPIVMLNSISGFNNVENIKLELMSSFGSNDLQTFLKVIFPNALPQVFTGIKLGGIFATIATVSTGFAGAKVGLGSRIVYYSKFVETSITFSCIILIAIIGITLFYSVTAIENRIIKWKK